MKFHGPDLPLLFAFLRREAFDFRPSWDEIDSRNNEFVAKCVKQITDDLAQLKGGADYVHIRSITNLGLVSRTLSLSISPYDFNREVFINLPPSFTNPHCNITVKDKTHVQR